MPRGTKAAPPQQSKLEEMWGKKKKPKAVKEEDKMDVEDMPAEVPKNSGMPHIFTVVSAVLMYSSFKFQA